MAMFHPEIMYLSDKAFYQNQIWERYTLFGIISYVCENRKCVDSISDVLHV